MVARPGVLVIDLAAARLHAADAVLATDLAELLVSCALVVGTDRALAAARAAVGDEALYAALPFLQRAALSPGCGTTPTVPSSTWAGCASRSWTSRAARCPRSPPRRVSARTSCLVLTAFAAYLLLGQLADIGLDTIVEELPRAPGGVGCWPSLLAQVTLVTDALATLAAVGRCRCRWRRPRCCSRR